MAEGRLVRELLPEDVSLGRRKFVWFRILRLIRRQCAALSDESGQSLAVWVAALFAMLLMLALVVDGGNAFFHKAEAQNAADAAALAGAHEMAAGERTHRIVDAIVTYAIGNGSHSGRYVIDWRHRTVTVSANDDVKTFFARVAGIEEFKAGAEAKARVLPIYEATDMLPLGVHLSAFRTGRTYRLTRDRGRISPPWWEGGGGCPGCEHGRHMPPMPPVWGDGDSYVWLDWDGRSPGNWRLIRDIRHPARSGTRHVGDRIWERQGVVENYWLWRELLRWRGRSVTVPVYDRILFSRGNRQVRVVGFASFVITNAGSEYEGGRPWWCAPFSIFCGHRQPSIEGYFVRKVIPSQGWDGPEYGMYTVNLIR